MNLTEQIEKACIALKQMETFNGLYIEEVSCQSLESKLADAASDGLSEEETRKYVEDYASMVLVFDLWFDAYDSKYISVEFDLPKLEEDFKEFILPYLGNDESLLPKEFLFEGGEMEFIK